MVCRVISVQELEGTSKNGTGRIGASFSSWALMGKNLGPRSGDGAGQSFRELSTCDDTTDQVCVPSGYAVAGGHVDASWNPMEP